MNRSIPIRRDHFFGIFVLSLALLAFQVVLTRLFSVVLFYHFAFAGISLAMLGLTLGADKVFQNPNRFSDDRLDIEWAKAALGFSLSSALCVLLFLYFPTFFPESRTAIEAFVYLSAVLFIIPFTYGGIGITLILMKGRDLVGRLYAADLLGAAIGCVGIVAVLFYVDPITVVFALGAFSCYAAIRVGGASMKSRLMLLAFLLATAIQGGLYSTDGAHLRVMWAKSGAQENILFERWNAFSRIRVIPYKTTKPFGWGWGEGRKPENDIEQKYLDIDADAGTVLTKFDGDLQKVGYLAGDIVNVGYGVRPVKETLVIGVGGGRDILSALYFGAQKVTGLELNPAIFEALTQKFGDFTGNLHKRPEVELINAEARSWISEHKRKVDLVQISLIDTWAATAAGGLTLAENKLYTVDAWKEFMDSLNPNGMLVVARWYNMSTHKAEFYRLLTLAVETLAQRGITPDKAREHILVYGTDRIVSIVVSPSPFTDAERTQAEAHAREHGFTLLASKDYALDDISRLIVNGNADDEWFSSLASDLSPPTDDRPFFFYTHKLSGLFTPHKLLISGDGENSPAIGVLFMLFTATAFCLFFFIVKPTLQIKSPMKIGELFSHWKVVSYFTLIGLGFMMVEISQMQRLMILLGHPVYGLSVVLFTLLLFGGIGSSTLKADEPVARLMKRAVTLCFLLALTGMLTESVTELTRHNGIGVRILASVALLAPGAFFMGMMFPIGMRLTGGTPELQSWLWGINGAASVFGSALGMMVSLDCGIAVAFWCGVACYLLCTFIAFNLAGKLDAATAP